MPYYAIRVELRGDPSSEEYKTLHALMAKSGFYAKDVCTRILTRHTQMRNEFFFSANLCRKQQGRILGNEEIAQLNVARRKTNSDGIRAGSHKRPQLHIVTDVSHLFQCEKRE
jgi:hypothetical protein